jgi:hypothetical protein
MREDWGKGLDHGSLLTNGSLGGSVAGDAEALCSRRPGEVFVEAGSRSRIGQHRSRASFARLGDHYADRND